MSSRLTAAGGSVNRGSMTVSGKWIASSSSSRSSRRSGPGRTEASAIARIRPGIDRLARYERTRCPSRSSTIDGTKTRYSCSPTRSSARTSSRA